ncbi:mechanosensitive ion channel family protein [Streptomyces sp. CHA1]|uniref:mechanosensitive ion channel family protein n=1 Tax=Streptomyces TaxID=1883 RepID=UPI0003C2BE1A|nr:MULTISPECIES: mechanosensitive ion channel domain-containing protein [Streptomyces]QOZ98572.1 mechanosensitive ion channel protein [Streptomyces violascens]ESQ00822.1 MscS Mechanosensitive ion channel [Streptomyces sp. GBA 94-10 4N24]ESQ07014.1 MscS Mechanosensitive ion channel [Streptomyces sp. PVA_94-07]MBT3157923.1 mechanosensitive ion channel [Streptomyces sp. G11C]MCO6699876.1 mechanosensitive ion channel family protein [Streptomyces sp. CHB9.2]
MENVLRPLIVVGGALALTLLLGWLADLLLRRANARHPETPLWGLLRRCRPPLQVVLLTAILRGAYRQTKVDIIQDHEAGIGQVLSLVLIASTAWLVLRAAAAAVESTYARYASMSADRARVRRVRTQVTLIMRIVTAVVCVVAGAAMLLTFPELRAVGTSMLASAGIIGIVAGVAAQSTLGNLFAGFQIAFGDMVRLGDTVVVDGEWGVIDEVTLTVVAVRTWDERRITMPVSYFTSKPFENWSRGGVQMTGSVFLQLDHRAPLSLMRKKTEEILEHCEAWDRRSWSLAVTDSTATTMEVRVVVTARDADDIWTARCTVREQLLVWLAEEHPYALPRVTTGPADPLPPRPAGGLLGKDGTAAADEHRELPDTGRG